APDDLPVRALVRRERNDSVAASREAPVVQDATSGTRAEGTQKERQVPPAGFDGGVTRHFPERGLERHLVPRREEVPHPLVGPPAAGLGPADPPVREGAADGM